MESFGVELHEKYSEVGSLAGVDDSSVNEVNAIPKSSSPAPKSKSGESGSGVLRCCLMIVFRSSTVSVESGTS